MPRHTYKDSGQSNQFFQKQLENRAKKANSDFEKNQRDKQRAANQNDGTMMALTTIATLAYTYKMRPR